MPRIGGPELIVLALIVLLLFGTTRLPKLARAMREAKDEFEKGQSGEDESDAAKGEAPSPGASSHEGEKPSG